MVILVLNQRDVLWSQKWSSCSVIDLLFLSQFSPLLINSIWIEKTLSWGILHNHQDEWWQSELSNKLNHEICNIARQRIIFFFCCCRSLTKGTCHYWDNSCPVMRNSIYARHSIWRHCLRLIFLCDRAGNI